MRATEPGLLDGIAGHAEPPEDAFKNVGGFSFVTDRGGGRVKKLPSFYVNSSQMYAHRDAGVVRKKLDRALDAFQSSGERGTYMLTACEIAGRKGLFGTDFFNRSPYRQKLRRRGMRFSDDPFVELDVEDGTFSSEDFGPFRPVFLAMPRKSTAPPGVVPTRGGRLVYQLTYYRIADIGPAELGKLAALAREIEALSATDPEDLATALIDGAGG